MSLVSAIRRRRAIRSYGSQELTDRRLNEIEQLLDEPNKFYPDVSAKAQLVRNGRELQEDISGILADYGKVEAPHYLVLTSEDTENGFVELGYRYEFVVLKLTNWDIGTCWIGKGFRDEELARYVDIPSGQKCCSLIAVGNLPEGKELYEIEEPKRKDLDHFLLDESTEDLSREILEILDCLRRAPSALNGQPWRVIVEEGVIHLYLKSRNKVTKMVLKNLTEMNRIDAGIGLRHLEVGGRNFWNKTEVGAISHPEQKGVNYIGSLYSGDREG
ncbi:MAG: nitroreductase family protein [Candidatus Bipolaricaulia bacterium]